MAKKIWMSSLVLIGLTLALWSGCGKRREAITVAGSTAFQPFAEKLAEEFMLKRPDISVTVQGGGSAVGIQSAVSGAADIGAADLVTLPPEAGVLTAVVVARDAVSLVVHPSNPISDLSTAQIRDIFNGKITDWKETGGPDKPITVVSREVGSGTRSSFEEIVGNISLTKNAIVQDSNGTIRETVANDPAAIGYITHGIVNEKVKAVSVDGWAAITENIMSGKYKIVRPIYLLTKGPPAGASKEFIDYVLSDEGQKVIRQSGLIPAR